MDKKDSAELFASLHPGFFEKEDIRSIPEEYVFDEMILPLEGFDMRIYDKKLDDSISFGFYEGSSDELSTAVAGVDPDWVKYFNGSDRVFCGYINARIASFCMIGDMGVHRIGGRRVRVGGPVCVGTLPEYRNRGIGLTMVVLATQILKDEGFDYSYIHYTGVAPWYEKLGYKTILRWNKNGIRL